MLKLIHGDCLTAMRALGQFDCVMADPPDNLGLSYGEYDDSLPDHEYLDLLNSWFLESVMHAPIVWFSFNAKWMAQFGACVTEFLNCRPEWTYRACTQAFTFGQHNHRWLGNNHRPLWCIFQKDAQFYPDQIRVPSWRQLNGDKRADPRGRVPGDVLKYERFRENTAPCPNLSLDEINRMLSKIDIRGEDECWQWTASTKGGYGQISIGGRQGRVFVVTRLIWRLVHGTDPAGQLVLHSCDNPGCCNPSHLFLGTDDDNNGDKARKCRTRPQRGSGHYAAKLTEAQVLEICASQDSAVSLAENFNVNRSVVNAIRNGRAWTHVTKHHLSDVFQYPRVVGNSSQRRSHHPTQLHEALVERVVKFSTKETGRVLDPFAGTGTTMRVCDRIGRDCTTIDIDRTYCEKIAAELDLKPVSLECWVR